MFGVGVRGIVEDDDAVIVEVDGVDEHINDPLAILRVVNVAVGELLYPGFNIGGCVADFGSDAQFIKLQGKVGFLRLQIFHLFVNACMGDLWRVNESIDKFV